MSSRLSGILVLTGTILTAFTNWYLILLFARVGEGASSVGAYSSILAIATPAFVFSQLGLRTILVSHKSRFTWNTFVVLRILGAAAGASIVFIWLAVSDQHSLSLTASVILLKIANAFNDLYQARLQYAHQIRPLGLLMIADGLATVGATTMGLIISGLIEVAILASATVSILSASVAAWISRDVFAGDHSASVSEIPRILKASIPVTASQFFASLLFQIPVLMLTEVGGLQAVGVYTSAAYLMTVASLIGSTLQTVLISPLRNLLRKFGQGVVLKQARRHATRVLQISAPVTVLVVLAGDFVLKFTYGDEFGIGYFSLLLLCISCSLTIVAYILSVALNVLNEYGRVTTAMSSSCLVAFAISLIMLSVDSGLLNVAFGASAGGAITRAISMHVLLMRAGNDQKE